MSANCTTPPFHLLYLRRLRSGGPTALPVAQVQGQRKQKVAGGRKGDRTSIRKESAKLIGGGMIRAGVAILMVPDPLPVVDEIAGLALIAGGAGLVYYG